MLAILIVLCFTAIAANGIFDDVSSEVSVPYLLSPPALTNPGAG